MSAPDPATAWRRLLRLFGTARFIREGIRARLLERIHPWQRESRDEFRVPFWGYDYVGHFDDAQDYMVYFRGGYENPELHLLAGIAGEVDGCISFDIGASTGQHMLVLSSRSARVFAFEPFPEVREIACSRLAHNAIGNVELLPFGLGTEDSELEYHWDSSNSNRMAGSFVASHANLGVYGKLEVRNGDRWAADAGVTRVDLIKLDVEGFEADVLLGLRRLLASQPFILMEVSWTAFDKIEAAGGLSEVLPFEFDLYRVLSGRDALLFNFSDYKLERIAGISRPSHWGYNVLVVPRGRPPLDAIRRHVRRR